MDFAPDDILDAIRRKDDKAIQAFRAALRRSLYLWTKIAVCYDEPRNLMGVNTYKERSDWIQRIVTTVKRGLLEDPRSYIKSTSNTRSVPGWVAIQRPHPEYDHPSEFARATQFLADHPHIKGVDSRCWIIGTSKEAAVRFSASTKALWDLNPLIHGLFPEMIWPNPRRTDYGSWTDEEYSLPGRLNPTLADEFMRTAGIESKIVGGRADLVCLNDLIGDHNWQSRTEVEKCIRYLSTAPAILEDRDPKSIYGGVVIVEGNRWSLDDMNSKIHDEFSDWEIWRRSVYRCSVHDFGNCGRWGSDATNLCTPVATEDCSLWPERYPDRDSLARLQKDVADPVVWAAQYLNDPTTASELDESGIVPFILDLRTYRVGTEEVRGWCAISGDGDRDVVPVTTLEPHLVSIDVASSDEPTAARTAVSWIARDVATARRYWLECLADRWKPDDAVKAAVEVIAQVIDRTKRQPKVLIEKVAAQVYMAPALRAQIDIHNRRSKVQIQVGEIQLIPRNRGLDKDARIRDRIGYVLRQNLFYLRNGLALPRAEMRHFPGGTKDTLDSFAQAEEIIMGIRSGVNMDELRAARARKRELRLLHATSAGVQV